MAQTKKLKCTECGNVVAELVILKDFIIFSEGVFADPIEENVCCRNCFESGHNKKYDESVVHRA